MNGTKLGTGTFLRLTGLSGPQMRGLEAAGLVNPSRADSGWRQFDEADLRAAIAWKTSQEIKRGKRSE